MEPVRVGVVGCGVIGRIHMRFVTANDQLTLQAIADVSDASLAECDDKFSPATTYADAASLFADPDVEAVVLALPTCHRKALALQAFAAGKHVLTEKPVALNAGEVRELIAAKGDLLGACCSSRHRFISSAIEATKIVESGVLGELRLLRVRGVTAAGPPPAEGRTPPAWRVSRSLNGGGIMVNWGCYDLDFMLGITGWSFKPVTAFAQQWSVAPHLDARVAAGSDAETHLVGLVACEAGKAISIERGEFTSAQRDGAWEIIGEKGSLTLSLLPGEGNEIQLTTTTPDAGAETAVAWKGDDAFDQAHAGPIADLGLAIREGRQPLTSLENALVVQQITDALYRSADAGQCMPV